MNKTENMTLSLVLVALLLIIMTPMALADILNLPTTTLIIVAAIAIVVLAILRWIIPLVIVAIIAVLLFILISRGFITIPT